MNTYKITNITNQLHKRDVNFKTPVKIEYVDDRKKKVAEVKTGENLFLTVDSLPLSIHRLRIKGLINVSEVSVAELKKMTAPKNKSTKKAKPEKPKSSVTQKSSNTNSSSTKKSGSKSSSTKKRSYSKSSSSKSSTAKSAETDVSKEETTT